MADNVVLNEGSGGATAATDEIDGVHWQRIKVGIGADGTAVDLSSTNPMPVTPLRVATAVVTSVAASVTSVTLLAANASRQGASFFNDSSAVLYLKLGPTSSTTSHTVQLVAGQLYELAAPVYTGVIDGIWGSATGSARATEVS
jgi:hypothetical protein